MGRLPVKGNYRQAALPPIPSISIHFPTMKRRNFLTALAGAVGLTKAPTEAKTFKRFKVTKFKFMATSESMERAVRAFDPPTETMKRINERGYINPNATWRDVDERFDKVLAGNLET